MTDEQGRMTPSRRAQQVPGSPIRALGALAERAKARGVRVIHLNIGQPDFAPPSSIPAALAESATQPLVYAPSRGLPELLEAWSAYFASCGITVAPDEVIATAGASEAIWLAALATLDPGDEVLVPEPFYAPYHGMLALAGARIVPVPPQGWLDPPTIDAFTARLTPRTRAILLCNPANPSGAIYPAALLAQLVNLAQNVGLFLLVDETYRDLVLDGGRAPSALEFPAAADHVIVLDSVSKRFNACGLRLGCLVTRNAVVRASLATLAELRLSLPIAEQRAVVAALRAPQPYVQQIAMAYRARRDALATALEAIPGVRVHRPAGAFYVVARLPVDDATAFAAWLLDAFTDEGETVMVTPMAGFYATPGRGHDEVRLALVHDPPVLERAAQILGRALAVYPGRLTEAAEFAGRRV